MTNDDELDLVETDRLIEAIIRRHSVTVIALLRPDKVKNDFAAVSRIRYSGGLIQALGLAKYAADVLLLWCREDDRKETTP